MELIQPFLSALTGNAGIIVLLAFVLYGVYQLSIKQFDRLDAKFEKLSNDLTEVKIAIAKVEEALEQIQKPSK